MSEQTTTAVFDVLAAANLPKDGKDWTVQSFTKRVSDGSLSVIGYDHTIDLTTKVVTVTFTVKHGTTTAKFAGKFKAGSVNEVSRDGTLQAPPTWNNTPFEVPVDAGSSGLQPNSFDSQIWYRYNDPAATLREFRFERTQAAPIAQVLAHIL